jgi:predicted transcriptional regulator
MTKRVTWNEENTAKLQALAGSADVQITREQVESIADDFGTSSRSIGNKLRNLGYDVQKAADKASAWAPEQEETLKATLEANSGKYTYAELETVLAMGFSAKQIQGKVLSMELFGHVRKAEKKEVKNQYSADEDARFVELCAAGATIESLSVEFGRSPASVRGKALSLLRKELIAEMPKQETSTAKKVADALEGLDVASMTVAEIAEASGKTERGIKSMLSHRGITAKDYDGAAKRAKLDAQKG